MPRKKPKLENGLCRKGVRLACVSGTGEAQGICIRVYCGSAADPVGKSGLAHLVEHLIIMTPSIWDDWFCYYHDSLVEDFRASTAYAYVEFKLVFKPAASVGDVENMLTHLLNVVFNSNLENVPFKKERRLLLNEIKRRAAHDAMDASAVQHVYADPAWSRPPAGLFAEASTLTLEDCITFYRELFRCSPIDIVLYGDLPFAKAEKQIRGFFNKKYLAKNVIQHPVAKCHVYDQGYLHVATFGHMHRLSDTSLLWCSMLVAMLNEKLENEDILKMTHEQIASSSIDMGECGVQTWHFAGLDARQHEIWGRCIEEVIANMGTLMTPDLFEDAQKEYQQQANDPATRWSVAERFSWPSLFIEHFNEAGLDIRESLLENMRAVTYEDFIQYHQKQKRPLIRNGADS